MSLQALTWVSINFFIQATGFCIPTWGVVTRDIYYMKPILKHNRTCTSMEHVMTQKPLLESSYYDTAQILWYIFSANSAGPIQSSPCILPWRAWRYCKRSTLLEVFQYIFRCIPIYPHLESLGILHGNSMNINPPGGVIYNKTSPWKSLDIYSTVFPCILRWRALKYCEKSSWI